LASVHQSSPSLLRRVSLPTLAPLFRQHAPSSRSPFPPPSFPRNLQPVASNDVAGTNASRRLSRTELDFEQALRNNSTVVLKESPDLQSLGVDNSLPSPSHRPSSSSSSSAHFFALHGAALDDEGMATNPSVVLPQTRATAVAASAANTPKISLTRSRSPSSSSSGDERYFDAEDGDLQTKRRSVFRSQGSASSPDLATLVRKTKERNGMAQRDEGKKDRNEGTTSRGVSNPTPSAPRDSTSSNRTRQRSSTTVHSNEQSTMPSSSRAKLTRTPRQSGEAKKGSMDTSTSSEWVLPSPRPRSDTLSSKVLTFSPSVCLL
jgi:hypothetical protein